MSVDIVLLMDHRYRKFPLGVAVTVTRSEHALLWSMAARIGGCTTTDKVVSSSQKLACVMTTLVLLCSSRRIGQHVVLRRRYRQ